MELQYESNRIFVTDEHSNLLAEVTFPNVTEKRVAINHTYVNPTLRGQGVAGQLLEAVANLLRQDGRKAVPTCSYAIGWFEKHSEFSDVLEDMRDSKYDL